jgi:hypothetical protein
LGFGGLFLFGDRPGVGFLPSRVLEEDRATMKCKQNVLYVQKKTKKMMMKKKKKKKRVSKLRGKNQSMN